MEHLLEIARIIDGSIKGDREKVVGYVEQLIRKLREGGDNKSADRLGRTLAQIQASEIGTAQSTGMRRLPVDNESRLSLADEEIVDSQDVSVVLERGIQHRVQEFVSFVKAADKLMASHVGISPSMIIYGPPGVGKTELARSIAGQLGLPLITARSDSLISSFLGSTAKNIRILFEHARSRPCVLFLDELDSLAKLRDDQHELGELKRVVVSLLQNIDALGNEIVLLGATNHPHLLDPAVWRRFAYRLEMTLPSSEVREQIFELYLGNFKGGENVAQLAGLTEGLSGSEIRQICEGAIRSAILSEITTVQSSDLIRGIVRTQFGDVVDFSNPSTSLVKSIHELAPKYFTRKVLAELFNSSESTIHRRLSETEDGKNGRRRKKTAD